MENILPSTGSSEDLRNRQIVAKRWVALTGPSAERHHVREKRANERKTVGLSFMNFLPTLQLVCAVVALLEVLPLADDVDQGALAAFGAELAGEEGLHGREAHAFGGTPLLANRHGARVIAHLLQHLGLDLADALARDPELLTHLFKRVPDAVPETEAHLDNLPFARGEELEHRVHVLFAELPVRGVERIHGVFILDEIPQLAVFFRPHRRLERDDVLADLLDVPDFLDIHLHLHGQFLHGRLAAAFLGQAALRMGEFVDRLDHVHRNADGARLIGDGAGDRLADPPRGIRTEFESAVRIEFLNGAEEADIALLNQVEEREAAPDVLLGNGDNKTEVRLGQLLLGAGIALADAARELDLFAGIDERHAADLGEVHAHRVVADLEHIHLALAAALLLLVFRNIFVIDLDAGGGDHLHRILLFELLHLLVRL